MLRMTTKFEEKVAAFIRRHKLLENGRALATLSGGADSVALLRVLLALGYDCEAAHCNFQLRGSESERDEAFARRLCERLSVKCHVSRFDTLAFAESRKMSVEMACRKLRYDWFASIAGQRSVAVAHHLDDSVETFFLNLFRGSGIAGLTGISPKNGIVERPLLGVSRKDILEYLSAIGQDYVDDSTNAGCDYARNRIRNAIMPVIKEHFPSAATGIATTLSNLSADNDIFQAAIGEYRNWITHISGDTMAIDTDKLMLAANPTAVLHELIAPCGFNAAQTVAMLQSAESGHSGRIFISATHTATVDRKTIIVEKAESSGEGEIFTFRLTGDLSRLPVGMEIEVTDNRPGFRFSGDKDTAFFSGDILGEELTLRHWRKGDRFRPFGMAGTQKLSDYFNNAKIPLLEKRKTWLLCRGDDILWIVGHRTGSRFKVTAETRRIVIVTVRH